MNEPNQPPAEPKACPFCGGPATADSFILASVGCSECRISMTAYQSSMDFLIEKWNRRAPQPETAPAPESAETPTPETDSLRIIGMSDTWAGRYKEAMEKCEELERRLSAALARVRVLETALGRLINQCDKTDWMGVAGEMDAVLDDSRKALQT